MSEVGGDGLITSTTAISRLGKVPSSLSVAWAQTSRLHRIIVSPCLCVRPSRRFIKNRRRDSPSAIPAAGCSYHFSSKLLSSVLVERLEREVVNHPYALGGLKTPALSKPRPLVSPPPRRSAAC